MTCKHETEDCHVDCGSGKEVRTRYCGESGVGCAKTQMAGECRQGKQPGPHCIFCGEPGETHEDCKAYWKPEAVKARYEYWASPQGRDQVAAVETAFRA